MSTGATRPRRLRLSIGQHAERGRPAVQQDCHGAARPASAARLALKGAVLALADGIGSSPVSHVAAQAAVRAATDDYFSTSETWTVKRSMHCVLAATNAWLHAQTQRGPSRHDPDRGHVCAFAALVLKGRTAHLFHAGDVRIYRLAGGSAEPLTEDHRVWIGAGRSLLSRAIGMQPQLDLDYQALPLQPGEVFVLASDGAYESLRAADYAAAIGEHGAELDAAARSLVDLALRRGSDDNATLQIVRIDELPPPEAAEMQAMRDGLRAPGLLAPRSVIDGWRIERELHASHRSHLYLATDQARGAPAVLKVPSVEPQGDAVQLDRLALEEWIARRVDNVHVLKAHPVDRPRSALYAVLEYVDGCTLAQWMRDHPRPELDRVRDIVAQIALGLQALHRLEMVHQDLRPENVMIDRHGTVRIIDLGAVRVAGLHDAASTPDRTEVLGTLAYTAPECFLGADASERSDQFSLGVIAYQMICGRLPYGTRVSQLRSMRDLAALRYTRAEGSHRPLPPGLDATLARAVHPLPLRRFDALSQFVHELQHPASGHRRTTTVPMIERDPLVFWRTLALLLAIAVVVLLGMLHARDNGSPGPSASASPT